MVRFDLDDVRQAIGSIDPVFLDSPQFEPTGLSSALGCSLQVKVETVNPVRSFKGRGTDTALASIETRDRPGAVCASAGNLGLALAYSAGRRGIPVTVFAAQNANPLKVARMRSLGAIVHLEGSDIELPRVLAREHAAATGAHLVEDSLDVSTCVGAATIALELVERGPAPDIVLVALGGGALASGVGLVMRELSPSTEVVGVQPLGAPAMALSWRAGTVVTTEGVHTIADGVAGRFPIPEVLADLLEVLHDVVLVEEASITRSMRLLLDATGLIVEPSAALGAAAVLEDPARFVGRRVATVLCGSNVRAEDFAAWTSDGV